LGGDEFVVLLENLSIDNRKAATRTKHVGEKILVELNQPYALGEQEYNAISASIGISLFNGYSDSEQELLKWIDIAMYQAKAAGRNTLRFFDPQMQAVVMARAALESELHQAVIEQQFLAYYQMQVNQVGEIIGVELLIRWQHPTRGVVMPWDFITLAEETGLILPIGQWVLQTACSQLQKWQADPAAKHLQIAVNVSAQQFHQADFVEQIVELLSQTAIDVSKLKLELTETLVLDDIEDTIVKMNALRDIGVRFSMDDFGTGYSSLSYLSELPFHQLKIDQSFVRNMHLKPANAVIVQTIIGMAKILGMEVIAEGVETEAQRDFLHQHGCLLCQGYLFSKPVNVQTFEQLLQRGVLNRRFLAQKTLVLKTT
jgi:predicted signal transduction protein with EAL and GGDEF domain